MKKMIKSKEITAEKDICLDFPKPQSFYIKRIFFFKKPRYFFI